MERIPSPHISLEQWRCLVAVVEAGGYAQAAEKLHKSQSSVTYAVQKLERLLNIKAFQTEGRRASLTPAGDMLYHRARQLLEDSANLERAADKVSAGWESEINIAVEALYPTWLLLGSFDRFGKESPHTRINLYETIIHGGPELLQSGRVDLAILPQVPAGFNGRALQNPTRIVPVAHADHPLHQLGRQLTLNDLRQHRHLVVRDTSSQRDNRTFTVDVEQRWTVSNMATSIGAVCRGYGFAWLPEDKIWHELASGLLKPLPLSDGDARFAQLYLIFYDSAQIGPGVKCLAEIIEQDMLQADCNEPDHV